MNLSNITISTDRLTLVPVAAEHIPAIFEHYRLPNTKYMNHTSTGSLEELTERHKKWRREMKEGVRLFVSVLTKDTEDFLGCFAIANIGSEHPEMGGWLKPAAHGKGYGHEVATALKRWAQDNLVYEYITWPCAIENVASCKLVESIGGVIGKEYTNTTASGNVWESREYRIKK